jgi:hypothetical protein
MIAARAIRRASGRQAGAALDPAVGDDGPTGTGAHAQPETVGLRAPAVVRLVRALAHVRLSVFIRPGREDRRSCGVVWQWPLGRRPAMQRAGLTPGQQAPATLPEGDE